MGTQPPKGFAPLAVPGALAERQAGANGSERTHGLPPGPDEQLERLVVEDVVHDERARRVRDGLTDEEPRPLLFGKRVAPGGRGSMASTLELLGEAGSLGRATRAGKGTPLRV